MQSNKTKILRFAFYFVLSLMLLFSFQESVSVNAANLDTFSGLWETIKLYFYYLVGIVAWTLGYLFIVNVVDVFIKQPLEGTKKDNTFLINLIHSTLCGISTIGWFLTVIHLRGFSFYITIFILSFVIMLIFKNIFPSFSGKKLSLSKPYSVGDWIEVKDLRSGNSIIGEVVDIKRKTIQIKTEGSLYISYSKSSLDNYQLINYSKVDGIEFENKILISSDVNPERAKRIIKAAVSQSLDNKGFLHDPEPRVFVQRFHDYTTEYKIKYWIRPFKDITPDEANDILNKNLYYHFSKVGINLNFTKTINYSVNVDKDEFEKKTIEPTKDILSNLELFRMLTQEELSLINKSLVQKIFAKNSKIIKEGDSGDSMFILVEGLLDVFISTEDKKQIKVAQLTPGNFFGEMSLLTGEQRSADVIANSESLVYEITKDTMQQILKSRPALVDELGKTIAERKYKNVMMQDEYDKGASSFVKDLIHKIKIFFRM
ncbi:MAG: mechanosensitive ion channel family protein [Ignavibacteriales bacterium]